MIGLIRRTVKTRGIQQGQLPRRIVVVVVVLVFVPVSNVAPFVPFVGFVVVDGNDDIAVEILIFDDGRNKRPPALERNFLVLLLALLVDLLFRSRHGSSWLGEKKRTSALPPLLNPRRGKLESPFFIQILDCTEVQ